MQWSRIFILLFCILNALGATAQVLENFSDGNLSENPTWTGDTDEFTINATLQLQSNGDTISTTNREIWISTPSALIDNTQWEFFVNPRVGTSSNNRMDVYLCSDNAQLTGGNSGYFVRIGGTPDEVALFRKDAGVESYVINGVSGVINSSSTNPTKVKVTRDAVGNWTLFADYEGTGNLYTLVGNAVDNTYTATGHFGLVVRYSNTNRQNYQMDDIYVGPIIVDETAPLVNQLQVSGPNTLELIWSENVEQGSAENAANYTADNGLGNPQSALRNPTQFQRVTLSYPQDFVQGQNYQISISGVSDLAGNVMVAQQFNFVYYKPKPYDIVINEIMADPTPVVLQPDVEWIELHNRTPFPVNLQNWILQVGTTQRTIDAVTIRPDSFLVLTGAAGEEFFFDSVAVKAVTSFPALTNTGASISLLDPDQTVISTVRYSDTWYADAVKQEGGWSLEQISPLKPCEGESNWTASNATWGATPGKRNSVFQNTADTELPQIERVVLNALDTIRVFFSETVPPEQTANLSRFSIDNGIGQPTAITTYPPDFRSIKLALPEPIVQGTIYTLSIADSVRDCVGNLFNTERKGRFAVPETPVANDIVINEILSDPRTAGTDFVEIYNRSNKIIDLAQLAISNQDTVTNTLLDAEQIAPEGYLMFPGEYLVLSENTTAVKSEYVVQDQDAFLQMLDFPAYNNEDGVVVLSKLADGSFIDRRIYFADLHFSLLNSLDGVSLERVNMDRPSTDNSNWNSAASTAGFATPGYRNSQFALITEAQAGSITISPETFSPDGDGFDDVLNIAYAFDLPGFTGTAAVYDADGRLMKYLFRSQLLGTSGTVSWNGITETNERARTGIYLVYLEAFDLQGKVVKLKKPCVLATRF